MNHTKEWFDPIYRENRGKLLTMARNLLVNSHPEIAEDIVQRTFMVLLMKEELVRDHPNIRGWLRQTLTNLLKNELRLARYEMEVPFPVGIELVAKNREEDAEYSLPSELSAEERKLLLLVAKGYKPKDIAKMEGITPDACRVRIMRARKHFTILKFGREYF